MPIVIKKRVSLAFLGDDYKDSFVLVKAVSVGEYDTMEGTVKDEVKKRVLGGTLQQDGGDIEITKDNIEELPGEVFVKIFANMTGEELDPKSEGLSTNPSTTDDQPLQK